MGLTRRSVGRHAQAGISPVKPKPSDRLFLLAGHPNVGKSTVFNALTGLKQHTGNWTGKTVTGAVGLCRRMKSRCAIADLPGCYSLSPRSAEEEVARDAVVFGDADRVIVVCDASCLERSLFLLLQVLEFRGDAVLCLNLMDEAARKGVVPDPERLSRRLGIPVVAMSARNKKEVDPLIDALDIPSKEVPFVTYPPEWEPYFSDAEALLIGQGISRREARAYALRLLDSEEEFLTRLGRRYGIDPETDRELHAVAERFLLSHFPARNGHGSREQAGDRIAEALFREAASLSADALAKADKSAVGERKTASFDRDRRFDRIFAGGATAYPILFLLLVFLLWLTVRGANYPSEFLSRAFRSLESLVRSGLTAIACPGFFVGLLCDGVIRCVGWVVSVMFPPMAIFFPLFTVLEDVGYLPRVAFCLDRGFRCCGACGKQALTMCMGIGCNAAGVVGCRILDSPRERKLALLTNSFMPCNGRFPILIAVISLFLSSSAVGSAVILAGMIVLAVAVTLIVSGLLSRTVLKGVPSSFTLELPSWRRPQIGQILVRSLFDRTLFVLGRAALVAAPTGALLWLSGQLAIGDGSLLTVLSTALDPIGRLMGLDGVILIGFLFGLPANEIVIPVILMCYQSGTSLTDYASLAELKGILQQNGWTALTAVCMILFTIFHCPCSTTILTIRKETGSLKTALASVLLPTAIGFLLCVAVSALFR